MAVTEGGAKLKKYIGLKVLSPFKVFSTLTELDPCS